MFGLYILAELMGFFAIMIVCTVLSIVFANKKIVWGIYAVGATLTLLSLVGGNLVFSMLHMVSYAVLLIIGVAGILVRRRLANQKSSSPAVDQSKSQKCVCGEWFYGDTCPNCGRNM